MDFIDKLLRNQGCAIDGTTISDSNPITSVVNSLFSEHSLGELSDSMNAIMSSSSGMVDNTIDNTGFYISQQNGLPTASSINMPVPQQQQMLFNANQNMFQQQQLMTDPRTQMFYQFQQQQQYMHMLNTTMYSNWQQSLQEQQSQLQQPQQQHYENELLEDTISQAIKEGRFNPEKLQELWQKYGQTSKDNEFEQSAVTTPDISIGGSKADYDEAWSRLKSKLESNDTYTYQFKQDNPYLTSASSISSSSSHTTAFDLGLQLYNDGKISQAIEAFEADLQENVDNDEGWRLLAACHAECDDDKRAIYCLKKAIEYDPYNLNALLALSISYVNEVDYVLALKTLRSWLLHNPRFNGLQVHEDDYSDGTLMDEVMQLLLQAESYASDDVDVLIMLGALCNASQDFDTAVIYFDKANAIKPNDYSILNKLGATLANNNQCEDAITYYNKAIEHRNSYARAWLNKGISYTKLDNHPDAIKSYITAIKLSPISAHIFNYVRNSLSTINRLDLIEICNPKGLDDLYVSI